MPWPPRDITDEAIRVADSFDSFAADAEGSDGDPLPEDFSPLRAPAAPVEGDFFHDDIRHILGADGPLAKLSDRYEERPQQVEMADTVARALVTNTHAVIEAGTGTGKTLAYLIPAVLSGKRVIVATATKALQEQLVEKDLPLLQKMSGRFSFAVMKGRSNYLCILRQQQFDASPTFVSREEATQYTRLRTWARQTKTGDRAELDLPESYTAWRDVSSTSETCVGEKCPSFSDCHVVHMRENAQKADIVVVNHHLFFADLAVRRTGTPGAEVIPRCEAVIFDEAHNMEEVATDFFGTQLSNWRFFDLCQDVDRAAGVHKEWPHQQLKSATSALGGAVTHYFDSIAALAPAEMSPRALSPRRLIGAAPQAAPAPKIKPVTRDMFDAPKPGAPRETAASDSEVASRARIVPLHLDGGDRRDTRWPLQADSLKAVHEPHLALRAEIDALVNTLDDTAKEGVDPEVDGFRRRCAEIQDGLDTFAKPDDPTMVYWAEVRGKGVFLRAAPVDVAPSLRTDLFEQPQSVIMTSATLATGGDTAFFRRRVGLLDDTRNVRPTVELVLQSPFDYERQAALYVPRHLPEVSDEAFLVSATEEIAALIALAKGRTFVLFTSLRAMKDVHGRLAPRLPYRVLLQGEKPKGAILRDFREEPSVLFATQSFWEGVDIQGDALSMVIIDKLPFGSPGDPLVAARMKAIEDRQGSPFSEYQLPSAAITLKQGFGRLIRSRSDTGAVAILDRRLWTKGYGGFLRKSLPPCPTFDRFADVKRWWKDIRQHE
jgi:ATP-dependent DNA helicase DinG